ncbi:hypothetical protein HK104_003734 [Borealophlyctis nickersoniae]|nr:hypothetical protein HK104_003734 [Borealophlyctis nickersoniae]
MVSRSGMLSRSERSRIKRSTGPVKKSPLPITLSTLHILFHGIPSPHCTPIPDDILDYLFDASYSVKTIAKLTLICRCGRALTLAKAYVASKRSNVVAYSDPEDLSRLGHAIRHAGTLMHWDDDDRAHQFEAFRCFDVLLNPNSLTAAAPNPFTSTPPQEITESVQGGWDLQTATAEREVMEAIRRGREMNEAEWLRLENQFLNAQVASLTKEVQRQKAEAKQRGKKVQLLQEELANIRPLALLAETFFSRTFPQLPIQPSPLFRMTSTDNTELCRLDTFGRSKKLLEKGWGNKGAIRV